MKKLYLILLVFVFNAFVCLGSEQIEFSSRLGKTISIDSRNYFGLFPDVKDYKTAILFKDTGYNYIEITGGKSEAKSKIILSDSAVSTLAYVIDNFEGIITEPAKYKLNGKLISGLIRISTQYNKKAKPVHITLRDTTEFSGFIIYSDSTLIVTTPDSLYKPKSTNFKITAYSDIYYISNVEYPIIDGMKSIFVINKEYFFKLSLFKNVFGLKVTPPEVLKLIKEQPIEKHQNLYESPLDFDKLYFKRMMVSADYSYQEFTLKRLQLLSSYHSELVPNLLSFSNYNSLNMSLNYRITSRLSIGIGYVNESIKFGINTYPLKKTIIGNAISMNFFYDVWHSRTYLYISNQFFANIFGGIQFNKYAYKENFDFQFIDNELQEDDITQKIRQSYFVGLGLRYKIDKNLSAILASFLNYHQDYGFLCYYIDYPPDNKFTTRNINYITSYGIKLGFELEI